MENRPDGAGAGRNAPEPRSGLFYLMLTNGRYPAVSPLNPFKGVAQWRTFFL